ncbi:hypothetical protein TWF730_001882 [Orbilia blumenaviensis]|uniref:Uncharacterized protein n=1 Tax=Orbilia blumenaviensis TaxID=1796055 RepID=A0AAV9UCS2_9PEZI
MGSIQDVEVVRYSISAFYAERSKDLRKAQSLHEAAVIGLKAIAEDSWHDQETRTICDKQAEFHASRYHSIRSLLDGGDETSHFVPPTALSAEESINQKGKDGAIAIGLEESILAEYLEAKKENTELEAPAQIAHLFGSTIPSPYTLGLDPTFPPKQYKITIDIDSTNYSHWLNAHPADHPDRTCYRLRANRWGKAQFENVEFYRATEFVVPCIDIKIAAVASTGDKRLSALKSREIEYRSASSLRPIVEHPETSEIRAWGSQKFTYGGRAFAWITPEKKGDMQLPTLYEVGSEVEVPGQNSRKGRDSVVGNKLCWGDMKFGRDASVVVTIAGSIDQLFEELLLGSQMTKVAIFLFGHDI